MTQNSLLTALCAAALTYLSLTVIFSSYGILEYRRHNDYAQTLRDNVTELERENARLLRRIEDLRTRSEAIVIEGRGIGLYRANEGVIRVVGYPNPSSVRESLRPGRMISSIAGGPHHYPWIRAVALSAGLLVLVIGMMWGKNAPQRARRARAVSPVPESKAPVQPRKVS
ncbi:MAG: septum formation initiator family protein [Spirochaeta sp.]|nr:septum formation initiator family protein [Spirochaeta sp.]